MYFVYPMEVAKVRVFSLVIGQEAVIPISGVSVKSDCAFLLVNPMLSR